MNTEEKLAEAVKALQEIAAADAAKSIYPGDGWRLAHEKFASYARATLDRIQS